MPEVNKQSAVRGPFGKTKPHDLSTRVQQIVNDNEALVAAYKRLFSSKDGEIILADLQKRFYDGALDSPDLNRDVGRRDVVHYIFHKLVS